MMKQLRIWRGPSVFMPREFRNLKALCSASEIPCRIRLGGGWKAKWFASAVGSSADLLSIQTGMGWKDVTDLQAIADKITDDKALAALDIQPK